MASIIQRNKSFSVVYTIQDGEKKKQKWETYHSYADAVKRREQLEIVHRAEKERSTCRAGTLAKFMEEYIALYGRLHWSCSTYTTTLR